MGGGVVENLLAETGSNELFDLFEGHFVDGRAGWSEGDGDALLSSHGTQRPDLAVEGFELRRKSAATAWVEEWAWCFFFGVVCVVGVGDVEGVGVAGRAGCAELCCGEKLLEFKHCGFVKNRGFPEALATEAAAEFAGGAG